MPPTLARPIPTPESSATTPRHDSAEVTLISAFIKGRVVRLGRSGFALRTHRAPIVGESYPCQLHLGESEAQLTGRVRWCVLKETAKGSRGDYVPTYHVGVEVVQSDRPAFHEMLDHLEASRETVH